MFLMSMVVLIGMPAVLNAQQRNVTEGAVFWRVDFSLARGNNLCPGNFSGGAGVKDGNFHILFNRRESALTLPLQPDGSGQGDVEIDWGHPGRKPVRVTVPPGTGPREVQIVGLTNNCTYRVLPR